MGREEKEKSIKYYFPFLIGGLLIFLFYVWECAEVVTLSYRINELKKDVVLLEDNNRHLKAKLYHYTNLANIDKIAREGKGMVFPQHENIVFLKVNFNRPKTSLNRAFFTAKEDSKDASEVSHRQFYAGSNRYSLHIGN